jgi:hypothetical protein
MIDAELDRENHSSILVAIKRGLKPPDARTDPQTRLKERVVHWVRH